MKTTLLILLMLLTIDLHAASVYTAGAYAQVEASTSSDKPENDGKLVILTNPVKDGQLRLKYIIEEGATFNVSIVNSLGEQVFSAKRNMGAQELTFDVSKLAAGLYFLRVNSDNSSVVKKLIIQ